MAVSSFFTNTKQGARSRRIDPVSESCYKGIDKLKELYNKGSHIVNPTGMNGKVGSAAGYIVML